MSLNRVIVFLVISYIGVKSKVVKDIDVTGKWSLDTLRNSTSIGYAIATTNSHNLAIAECSNYAPGISHINCKVILRSHNFNGKVEEKSCDLEHPVKGRTYLFRVYSLSSDRVIVTFSEDLPDMALRLTLRILDTTNCKSNSRSMVSEDGTNLYFHKMVRNQNTFDIVYISQSCGNNLCKVTYNFDGEIVDSRKNSFRETFHNILKIDRVKYSSFEDYFFVDKSDKFKADIVFSPVVKVTKQHNVYNYFYSNSSGVARVCWHSTVYNSKIECLYLEDTVQEMSLKIPLSSKLIAIYNLEGDEFLLILKLVSKLTQDDEVLIAKVDSNGLIEELKRYRLGVKGTDSVAISRINKSDFCFSFLSIDESAYPVKMNVNFISKCQTIL